jgi:hypothetical protein
VGHFPLRRCQSNRSYAWSLLIEHPGTVFLFRVGLALVHCCRQELLEARDAPAALALLAVLPLECLPVDAEAFLTLAHAAKLNESDVLKQRTKMEAQLRMQTARSAQPRGSMQAITVRRGERF